MALKLVTGPANAGKARHLVAAVRAHAAAGEHPWLVVPTAADVQHYRRELAAAGVVLGARVARFGELCREMARRAGLAQEAIDAPARERVLCALATRDRIWGLEPATARALARDAGHLIGELESLHVDPERLGSAVERWRRASGCGPAAAKRGAALARLYAAYRDALGALGLLDEELRTARASDALRAAPQLWAARGAAGASGARGSGGAARRLAVATPVCFYGFDDLTAAQLDAIQTLGVSVDAPVAVALAFEPGREAFAARARAFQTLAPWAAEHVSLPPSDRHYAPHARSALGHAERRLFEADANGTARPPTPAGDAVRLLEGASERAELELVAAEARALVDRGVAPAEIAIVHRQPETVAAPAAAALAAHGLELRRERSVRFAHTAVGRGLIALVRCALGDADAAELVRFLRTPGVVRKPALVDRLERTLSLAGTHTANDARARWEERNWTLDAIDRVRQASERGPAALLERLERELWGLYNAPRKGAAAVLEWHEEDEAAALRAGASLLTRLREVAGRASACDGPRGAGMRALAAALADPTELVSALAELSGARWQGPADAIALSQPFAVRGRRVRALFACGLQEAVFPAPVRHPGYLDEDERAALALAGELPLTAPADPLGSERYLFYACVSRPEETLVLSWHLADDDGNATPRSLFVDDLRELVAGEPRPAAPAGAIAGAPQGAPPTAPPVAPPVALEALADERVLAELGGERLWSPSGLEAWVRCPVRWFVERFLRPAELEPSPEAMAEGAAIHAVLKDVLEGLRGERGSARLHPPSLERARSLMRESLALRCDERPLSVVPELAQAGRRRLEAQLDRYLTEAAGWACEPEPERFELAFGFAADADAADGEPARALPALDLGKGVRVRGRIDRIDTAPDGGSIVYDYKRSLRSSMRGSSWLEEGTLQVALYMRAAEALLGKPVVGGLYQPLSGGDLRPRGVLADGAAIECVRTDRRDAEGVTELVDAVVGRAREAALEARAGRLRARPHTCGRAGCAYPAICGCER